MALSVEPLATRTSRIDKAGVTGRQYPIRFRGSLVNLPVKRVPTESLVYRMANIRTIVKQKSFIAEQALAPDFFSAGQENTASQNAQHKILLKMSKEATANIFESLRQLPELTEPLLITHTGIVLNGNRRLSAIRELHHLDAVTYSAFTHVEVAILPVDCNEDDLSEIETALQIAPELKSDYGWIEETLGLKFQLDELKWSLSKAASSWRATEKELQERLDQLVAVNDYLAYLGEEGNYELVQDNQQAVETFVKSRNSQTGTPASLQDAQRYVMFAVLGDPDISNRKYEYARDIATVTDAVLERLDVDDDQSADSPADSDDPLAGLAPLPGTISPAVVDFLADMSNADKVAQLAEEALTEHKEAKQAAKKGRKLLDGVKQAHSKLAGLKLTNAEEDTFPEVAANLLGVQLLAAQLMLDILEEDEDANSAIEDRLIKELQGALEKLLTVLSDDEQ